MSHPRTGKYAHPSTCACGRFFTTSSGAKNHGAKCPIERARSAAFVAAIEDGRPHDAWTDGDAAARAALATAGLR